MANLTSVTLTAGVPTAGTGTVGTIDNVTGTAGSPSVPVLTVQGVGSGTPQPVSGTVAATQSGTWNVTNVSGTVSLPTGASTSALQPTNAAQGSTTSGQTGVMTMGAVTTASPTYTTAQTSPLSLDTTGALRVNVTAGGGSGGTSSTVGATAPSVATAVGFTDGTNKQLGVIKPASTAPIATDRAIVVGISPNSAGIIATAAPGTLSSGAITATVVNPSNYETVAASATAQVMGSTGATGDFFQGLLVIPATTSPGAVSILDNATSITVFTGGATSVSNLVPFFIPLGMTSVSGAWKVTTGTNVSCIAVGKFT